jgi:hypothetical protein
MNNEKYICVNLLDLSHLCAIRGKGKELKPKT